MGIDIGMIALSVGLLCGAALVGVYCQVSGRDIQYPLFPPNRITVMKCVMTTVFLAPFIYMRLDAVSEWSAMQHILFVLTNALAASVGYVGGYRAMEFISAMENDEAEEKKKGGEE